MATWTRCPILYAPYPVAKALLPKVWQSNTNFSKIFSCLFELKPLDHFEMLHPQSWNNLHTRCVGRDEEGPRGLIWQREILLNKFSRSVSFLQNQERLLPNERDGISVIEFSSPAMCKGVNGDTPDFFNCSINSHTSYIATNNPLSARRFTHPIVGELSLNNAT